MFSSLSLFHMHDLSGKKKSYKKWLFLAVALLVVLGSLISFTIKSFVPKMDGEVSLKYLSGDVKIIRDQYGIPHITATNALDAFRALGYVMASERLFQMEMQRRMASGELSELFGEKTLATDKLFRSLGLRAKMQEMLQRKLQNGLMNAEFLKEVDAFYDGVNQFQSAGKLPVEFKLLGIQPRPFTLLDGYAFVGLMSFSFGVATSEEPLMTNLREKLGRELSDELRNDLTPYEEQEKIKALKKRVVDNNETHYPVISILNELEKGFTLFDGSNGWVVSGKRSASGFPILVNDPHITYSHPGIWFEAQVTYPGHMTYGHFLPLIPYPVLSHNNERGWGLTMSLIDDMDIYREKIDYSKKTYEFKGEQIPYRERFERILVKKESPQDLLIVETQHGPVMDAIYKNPKDKSLAVKWAFLNPENDPLMVLFNMGRARSMDEFKKAVSAGIAPGLNVLYADKKNIGWWIFGEVAKKSPSTPTDFILDGSSGKDEYLGYYSFNEKPHLENPASGIIVSANARPVGAPSTPSDLRGDWQPDDRYKTLNALLSQKEVWSVEEFKEIQTLGLNLENKLILDALLKDIDFQNLWKKERAKSYLDILKKWDFISDKNAVAPTLYYTWSREIVKALLKDLTAEDYEAFTKLPNGWNFFKRVALNAESPWWKKYDRKQVLTSAFNSTIESLRQDLGDDSSTWTWGNVHTIEFVHPIGKMKPLNKIFNVGPYGLSGAAHEINNQKQSGAMDGFKVKAGPSTRRIIDFAHPEKAWGILPIGNSGNLFSPYYKDQVQKFLNGEYREEWLDENDILAHKSHELVLKKAL